jgi:hypothetical protein
MLSLPLACCLACLISFILCLTVPSYLQKDKHCSGFMARGADEDSAECGMVSKATQILSLGMIVTFLSAVVTYFLF